MIIKTNEVSDNHYATSIIMENGIRYNYECLVYGKPTVERVLELWSETRKYWNKSS